MIPTNNSHHEMSVYLDWLIDQERQAESDEYRLDVEKGVVVNQWTHEYRVGDIGVRVGGGDAGSVGIGVGGVGIGVGGVGVGVRVGSGVGGVGVGGVGVGGGGVVGGSVGVGGVGVGGGSVD